MQLFSILIDVVGPVFLVALVGYLWARRGTPFDPRFVSLLVTSIGTPCLVIDNLSRSGLKISSLGVIALACVMCHAIALLGGFLFLKAIGQPLRVYLPSIAFPNSGNMGLPLALFAFGDVGLGFAIAFYATASLMQFTIGQSIASGRLSMGDILRMPLVWALVVAIGLAVTGLQLPSIAARAVHILAGLMVPLMLLSLGYSLASLKMSSMGRATMFSAVRLLGGFAIGWLVASTLGLEGAARGTVVAQAAMPAAVFNYMFAEKYGNRPEEVAGIVVVSTLMSIALLPIFLATVI